jgi:hypothetical protein
MTVFKNYIKPLYFSRRFYWSFVAVIMLFILSFLWNWLMNVAQVALVFFIFMVLLDYAILFLRRSGL